MSKSVASESNDGHEGQEMSGERGARDGGNENEEGNFEAPSGGF